MLSGASQNDPKRAQESPRWPKNRPQATQKRPQKEPKSDKKIAIELNKKGYGLARRTVSKYRKKSNIPSSRNR